MWTIFVLTMLFEFFGVLYKYIYIYIFIYIYIYIFINIYMYIYIYTYTCRSLYRVGLFKLRLSLRLCVRACVRTDLRRWLRVVCGVHLRQGAPRRLCAPKNAYYMSLKHVRQCVRKQVCEHVRNRISSASFARRVSSFFMKNEYIQNYTNNTKHRKNKK